MAGEQIVVRRRLDSGRPEIRTGEVIGPVKQGSTVRRVRWNDDGTEEDVILGRADATVTFTVAEDSLAHLRLLGVEEVIRLVERSPLEAFLLAVHGGSRAGVDPVAALVDAGVTQAERVFARVRDAFESHPNVAKVASKRRTYKWTGAEQPKAPERAGSGRAGAGGGTPADPDAQADPLQAEAPAPAPHHPVRPDAPAAAARSAPGAAGGTAPPQRPKPPPIKPSPLASTATTPRPAEPVAAPGASTATGSASARSGRPQQPRAATGTRSKATRATKSPATTTPTPGPGDPAGTTPQSPEQPPGAPARASGASTARPSASTTPSAAGSAPRPPRSRASSGPGRPATAAAAAEAGAAGTTLPQGSRKGSTAAAPPPTAAPAAPAVPAAEQATLTAAPAEPTSPAVAREASASGQETPLTSQEHPATAQEAPAAAHEAPATTQQAPAAAHEVPANAQQAPAAAQQAAASDRGTPATPQQAPASEPAAPATAPARSPRATTPRRTRTAPATGAATEGAPRRSPSRAVETLEKLMHQLATGTITAEKRETLGDLAARDGEPPVGRLLLGALTGAVDLRLAEHLTRTPLATAARLAQFSGEVLAAAAGAVPEKVWLSLLAPLPGTHASADVDVVDLLGVEAVARIARHAAAELREAPRRADVQPSADALVDRLVSSPRAAQLALATLTDLLALPEPADETGAKRLERLLGLAAAGLRAMDGVAWAAVTEAQRTALARATARAALTGARGAVLAAIAQVDPAEIIQARWWAGVDLDHLSTVTSGPLAAVLERDDVARSIVAPKAQAALRDVSTRRALLGLLASAAPVAATLSPPVVAATLGRVASSDRLLRAWLQEIQELEALHALELERDRLAHRLAEAETHVAAAREAADRHRAQAERLEARVREAERANATMREAQERQIRIDAIRALAELAAFVESSSGRVEPDRLKARVTTLVGRQGVRRVEIPDDVVAFDPRRHESVGVAVEPGEGVVVRRCGYTWDSPQEEIVLVRALVERAEHEEEH